LTFIGATLENLEGKPQRLGRGFKPGKETVTDQKSKRRGEIHQKDF